MLKIKFKVATKRGNKLPSPPIKLFDKCYGRREKSEHRSNPLISYPVVVAEALWDLPKIGKPINSFLPNFNSVDKTYSKWLRGDMVTEDFLKTRGGVKNLLLI